MPGVGTATGIMADTMVVGTTVADRAASHSAATAAGVTTMARIATAIVTELTDRGRVIPVTTAPLLHADIAEATTATRLAERPTQNSRGDLSLLRANDASMPNDHRVGTRLDQQRPGQ